MTLTETLPVAAGRPGFAYAAPPTVPEARARWVRPAVAVLLAGTAVLYLWGLGASGWANAFYSAAVQAGAKSWKAFFFGSSDASNFITVDKTPASLWVMDLSARIFGVNSWSILVPQALEGVAAVGLLYLTVRRWSGPVAGLVAGAAFALTPVAVLMFRFNNPDALLVLLLVGAAYAVTRALEAASTRWLMLAGALVGAGFLTKMLQAFLVLPAFALVYLVAAPTPLRRRILQVLAAGGTMLVAAGWWVAIVSLIPAADRPYIGGSQHNSVLELAFGYNGFGRLTGDETGSVGGGGPGGGNGGGMWGATGWTRMFSAEVGGQVAWLIPAALVLLAAGLWATRRAPRTDRLRAAYLLWGGWLLVTGLTFSFMAGIFHPYYTVALAPAIGALVGIGGVHMFRARRTVAGSVALAVAVALTTWTAWVLLGRSSAWHPWIATAVVVVGVAGTVALLASGRIGRWLAVPAGAVALAVTLAGSAAYAVDTAATAHSGAIPSAGPAVTGGLGGPGGPGGPGGGPGGGGFGRGPGGFGGTPPNGATGGQGGLRGGNAGGLPAGGLGGFGGPGGFGGGPGGLGGGPGGGAGGLLEAGKPSAALVSTLQANASDYRWVAAAIGSNNAAGLQLGTGKPVMAIGGFNGSDPAPTLAQFQAYVAAGDIHYFIASGGFGGQMGGSGNGAQIAAWVEANFTAQPIGNTTVYDLTAASS